jgi:hypothetical protein
VPYAGPQYYAFITNTTGSTSPVYRLINKSSASFQVVSTAPFNNGDRLDFLTISGGLGPVWDGSVIAGLSGTIDARFFSLSGTIDARFAAGGGGYLGKGVGASSFAAGSIVKRGPFLFGTFSGSSVDPMIVEGNPGSPSDWRLTGSLPAGSSQSGSILILNAGNSSRDTAAFRLSTNTGIDKKRLICEAVVGGTNGSCADAFSFGIFNSSEGMSASSSGLRAMTGALGVEIDVFNNRVAPFQTGSGGPVISTSTTAGTAGNDILKSPKFYRWYLDINANGAGTHLTMSLYRDNWDNTDLTWPGYIAEWIVQKPSWISDVNTVTWRSAVGSWSGGVAGTFKVRSFFVESTVPEWDLVSALPHTPRVDWRIF